MLPIKEPEQNSPYSSQISGFLIPQRDQYKFYVRRNVLATHPTRSLQQLSFIFLPKGLLFASPTLIPPFVVLLLLTRLLQSLWHEQDAMMNKAFAHQSSLRYEFTM
jgi:hypothetical protein